MSVGHHIFNIGPGFGPRRCHETVGGIRYADDVLTGRPQLVNIVRRILQVEISADRRLVLQEAEIPIRDSMMFQPRYRWSRALSWKYLINRR